MGSPTEGADARQAVLHVLCARHNPCPAPRAEGIGDKYKGKFDQGWDKLREETFARPKKLGVIPQEAALTVRHKEIPAWDDMPEALKPVLVRQMEVYAGFLDIPTITSGGWWMRFRI